MHILQKHTIKKKEIFMYNKVAFKNNVCEIEALYVLK